MTKVLPIVLIQTLLACSLVIAQPSAATSYIEKGRTAYENGDVQTALRDFKEALRLDRSQPNVYTYLGNIYFILGDYDLAESYFTSALEQHWKNANKQAKQGQGTFQQDNIIILDPSGAPSTTEAMLYNNRGAARYQLGDIDRAVVDFREALELQPDLEVALLNWETIEGGNGEIATGIPRPYQSSTSITSRRQPSRAPSRTTTTNRRKTYTTNTRFREERRHPRPRNVPPPSDIRSATEKAEDFREARLEITDIGSGSSRGLPFLSKKPFKERKVPARGKVYRKPSVKAASQDYISIEEVKITSNETRVRVRVQNPESRTYSVSLSKPTAEGAYYINDRSGTNRGRVRLKKIEGIEAYPKSTQLRSGSSLEFTLVFGKIPDKMGHINILEGKTEDGSEWNFYGVDLTR